MRNLEAKFRLDDLAAAVVLRADDATELRERTHRVCGPSGSV
jgi:hypothetical protein